jgi:hypothetical protein
MAFAVKRALNDFLALMRCDLQRWLKAQEPPPPQQIA